ncbi:MAG: class I SAM-dependent methyltransferase [Ruminococcus sp.]|nr:class I SAM-dependent methyltransferase [Ruminococcus sp.]
MFWDKVAGVYDFFENIYNKSVYQKTGEICADHVDKDDTVLECACGTGAISVHLAPKCKRLIATDFSRQMLRQAQKKCEGFNNVSFKKADITSLKCRDNSFDAVVAGNVIHLLDEPYKALKEFERVCKRGGRIIIPTYINVSDGKNSAASSLLELMGVDFKREFDIFSYKAFFEGAGYEEVEYELADGKMPCAIAIIKNNK